MTSSRGAVFGRCPSPRAAASQRRRHVAPQCGSDDHRRIASSIDRSRRFGVFPSASSFRSPHLTPPRCVSVIAAHRRGDQRVTRGYFSPSSVSLDDSTKMEEATLRARIQEIMQDASLSDAEKCQARQKLLTGNTHTSNDTAATQSTAPPCTCTAWASLNRRGGRDSG